VRFLRCFLLAAAVASAADTRDLSRAIFSEIDRVLKELTRISGLKIRRNVEYDLISRDKVREFLEKRIKEVATPKELRAEELALKKFGFVPQDFDLAKSTVELLTEQAVAFYDFRRKKLYIIDWTQSAEREAALVHELAHALADQNFNLDRYLKKANENDDGAMASMAVMEGQASWLMSEYLANKMGKTLKDSPEMVGMMSRSAESPEGQFPVFDDAPLYLRRTLIFPYTDGMLFQNAVVERLGQAGFSELFKRPPASTQQILHSDKYFSDAAPSSPALPVVPRKRDYHSLIGGSIGELDHAIMLEQHLGKEEAKDVSPHWKGGSYELYERRAGSRVVLAYASEWDGPEIARRFFLLYRKMLEKKWKSFRVNVETPDRIEGTGDDGYFCLLLDDATFTSIEGLEEPLEGLR
jgi:hypothetical protein